MHLDDRFEAAPREPSRMSATLQVGALRVRVPGAAANTAVEELPTPLSSVFPSLDAQAGRRTG